MRDATTIRDAVRKRYDNAAIGTSVTVRRCARLRRRYGALEWWHVPRPNRGVRMTWRPFLFPALAGLF